MKKLIPLFLVSAAVFTSWPCFAQLNIPSDGSDGALNITSDTIIDLGLARTAAWDANNSTDAGKGVYDVSKWAVVFKYSSVNIAAGATVTFKNHPSRCPVVWLVQSNVTVSGVLSLDGERGLTQLANLVEGGPGGFRGGARGDTGLSISAGFGPGGIFNYHGRFGAQFPQSYGSDALVPLIGGSGGAGNGAWNGGGGGGAILVAAGSVISISGYITANGGDGPNAYGGSGGAIRLVADQLLGNGYVRALSGQGDQPGRIRIEANTFSQNLSMNPLAQPVSPTPVVIWPATNAPTVRVVSVSGIQSPNDPRTVLENNPADLSISSTNAVTILVETQNFPTNGTVRVFVKPRHGLDSIYQASFVSSTNNAATWQVQQSLPLGYCILQARAVAQ